MSYFSMKPRVMVTLLASVSLLSACAVGPNYQRPNLDVPAKLASGATTTSTSKDAVEWLSWWKSFNDPVLNQLLEEALAKNQDLQIAIARIDDARASAGIAMSNRFPTVDANLGASRTRTSENSGKLPSGVNPTAKDFQFGLSAAYEVDLFGRLSRADEAAKARLLSQEATRGVVQTSLIANVAQTYFSLRAFDAQLALADASLKTRQENLHLQQKRFAAGSIGEGDLRLAEAELAASEITQVQAKLALNNVESALAVLLGRSSKAILQTEIARGASIDQLYQQVKMPAELPSDLLNRRPDLIAAEQNLVAANADVGQAKSSYFPSLKLTTGIGRESRVLSDLFNPASLLWNVGSSLVQPIFRAGAVGAVVEGAEARKRIALGQYVQSVQGAFRDVHDALATSESNQQIESSAQHRVSALKQALHLAELRYQNGYSSYLEVLNAQRDLMTAETAIIDAKRAHLSAIVNVYKAVGGGWAP
jgi:multidrug efflux system outer membrane protein